MYHRIVTRLMFFTITLSLAISGQLFAAPPNLKTPAPVIYLEDNLNEAEQLGWCIDTVGRGLSDRLHAHSCKPQGGDVQFRYDAQLKQIVSVAFPQLCMSIEPSEDFALLPCDIESASQKIEYNQTNLTFSPLQDPQVCIAVASEIRNAGPFQSRDLVLQECDAKASQNARWVIKR